MGNTPSGGRGIDFRVDAGNALSVTNARFVNLPTSMRIIGTGIDITDIRCNDFSDAPYTYRSTTGTSVGLDIIGSGLRIGGDDGATVTGLPAGNIWPAEDNGTCLQRSAPLLDSHCSSVDDWADPGDFTPFTSGSNIDYHRYTNEFVFYGAGNSTLNNVNVKTFSKELLVSSSDPKWSILNATDFYQLGCETGAQIDFPTISRIGSGNRETYNPLDALANISMIGVFPNPTDGYVKVVWNIETSNEDFRIDVISVMGQVVASVKFVERTGALSFDMSAFTKGVYRVLLRSDQKILTSKTLVLE